MILQAYRATIYDDKPMQWNDKKIIPSIPDTSEIKSNKASPQQDPTQLLLPPLAKLHPSDRTWRGSKKQQHVSVWRCICEENTWVDLWGRCYVFLCQIVWFLSQTYYQMSNSCIVSFVDKPVDPTNYLGLMIDIAVSQEDTQDVKTTRKPEFRRVKQETRLIGLRSLSVKRLRSRTIKIKC